MLLPGRAIFERLGPAPSCLAAGRGAKGRGQRGNKGRAAVETVLTEWASLLIRWIHVIAGIGWIGASFYFIHLDLSLKHRADLPAGVKGEAWQVHGGGFYHMLKYMVAPSRIPDHLTWFKWEAYATWLSGFALLVLVYYLGADLYLIDKSVLDVSATTAAVIAFASLLAAWLAYEAMCRSPLGRHEVALALCGYVFLVALTYAFTQVFSGRGAFTQIGALIGTIMVANVFVVIIPNQKKMIAAMLAGREPDGALGAAGKQRSVHNNYLTLPVVFLMISNHYPLLYATRHNWLIVAIVLAIGPVIRHFYNSRHEGKGDPWWTWAVAAAGMAVIAWLSAAGPRGQTSGEVPRGVTFAAAEEVVTSRCAMCHASEPVWTGIVTAPKAILLDTPERIRLHAPLIDINAVRSRAMPPGNVTEMTDEERRLLAGWILGGAKAQ
ncbi:MAG: urate hydroxylase PuuD [Variibacter sp.]|nr:urate hydroxylase PuuD [Variibacter sp.]